MSSNDEKFYAEVGVRIRAARTAANLTQTQLAKMLGVSRTTLTNMERGGQAVYVHVLVWAAQMLEVPIEALLPDEPEPMVIPDLSGFDPDIQDWIKRILARGRGDRLG